MNVLTVTDTLFNAVVLVFLLYVLLIEIGRR